MSVVHCNKVVYRAQADSPGGREVFEPWNEEISGKGMVSWLGDPWYL
jgi:hypothetical protein